MQLKTISDYYDIIQERFPEVSLKDIKYILNYGWKSLYLCNSYGGDTLVQDNDLWFYIGQLTNNSLHHFNYYANKLAFKIRTLYKRKKIQWDGNYYFALSDSQYQDYQNQQNKRGRKRKNFEFRNIHMFKILDECKIRNHAYKYIFKIPYGIDLGYRLVKDYLKTADAELIIEREPLKFEDILVSNNNFEAL